MSYYNYNNTSDREYIRNNVPLIDYAESLGLIENKSSTSWRGKSIFDPGENTTCTAFGYDKAKQWFYDHKVGKGGDVITLSAIVKHGGDFTQTYKEFREDFPELGENKKVYNQVGRQIIDTDIKRLDTLYYNVKAQHSDLKNNHKEVLNEFVLKRGISEKQFEDSLIGIKYYKNEYWLTIPFFDRLGRPFYEAYRFLPNYSTNGSTSKNYPNSPYVFPTLKYYNLDTKPLWGIHTLDRGQDTIYIAEGMFDAITLDQLGYSVLTSGNKNAPTKKETLDILLNSVRKFKNIVIVLDNDDAGKDGSIGYSKLFLANKFSNVKVVTLPDFDNEKRPIKDISEYFQYNGQEALEEILENYSDNILIYLAQEYLNEPNGLNEIRKIIAQNSRWLSFEIIEDLLMTLEVWAENPDIKLTKQNVKILRKSSQKPTNVQILDEVLQEYELIHTKGIGFYEFNGQIWQIVEDSIIKSYIQECLGKFATGAIVDDIFKMLINKCSLKDNPLSDEYIYIHTKEIGDMRNLIAFQNGTLDLDSGEFQHGFNKEDYLTTQMTYDYNPNALAPEYTKFLLEVMDNDIDKYNLILECLAYSLFLDNRLEKLFWFVGRTASNGKSTVLNIHELVLGSKNCSALEVNKCTEPFHAIQLKGKKANILRDETSTLYGKENNLKKIVSGEPTEAGRKFHDYDKMYFNAKWYIASNHMPQCREDSEALERRIIFIEFNQKYTDNPKNEFEHKKDINLIDKLKKELSGIFNLYYSAYKNLKANKKFSETPETKRLSREFTQSNNTVLAYFEDVFIPFYETDLNNMEAGEYFIPLDYYDEPDGLNELHHSEHGKKFDRLYDKDSFYRKYAKGCGYKDSSIKQGNTFVKSFNTLFKSNRTDFISGTREHKTAWIKIDKK